MTTTFKVIGGLIMVVGLLAVGLLLGNSTKVSTQDPKLGGGAYQALPWWFGGGIKINDVNEGWTTLTLGAGQDQLAYTNSTGRDIIYDYAEIQTIANAAGNATASSTFRVRLFATSTATVPDSHDFTAVVLDKYALVVGTWATSTTATTTNSVGTVSVGAQGAIRLPSGWSLIAYWQAVDTPVCGGLNTCEEATSTNRGFDAKVRAHYHFDD
jgi:hypothetical protein